MGNVPDRLIGAHVKRWEHGDGITVGKNGLTTGCRGRVPGAARKGTTRIDRAPAIYEQGTGDPGLGVLLIRQATDLVSLGGNPRVRGCAGCRRESRPQI